jgi:IS4 transposase
MSCVHGKLKTELGELLYLIDSTLIPLQGKGYDDWAIKRQGNRTQGLKVHLMIASGAVSLPIEQTISAANINDIDIGRRFAIEAGATYVFDKGYYDYNWWHQLDHAGASFVTRLKRNAGVEQTGIRGPSTDASILADEYVQFRNKRPGGKRLNRYHGRPLRRVTVARPDKSTPLVLVTNDFDRSAKTIADLYKQRWEIELFFKWLKQNLKIKRFLGRSENAVKIQLYTAMIAYLLVHLYRQRQGIGETLALVLSALRVSLFSRYETDVTVSQRERRCRQDLANLQPSLLPA